ncbi:MAG: hypothetical protein ACR2GD_13410 [Pyrinomonadaceae bacterium]
MEITISVSERAEQKIREQAALNGKDVNEFVGEFVEENFANGKMNGNDAASSEKQPERRFMRMKGMFSGGDGNSAERVKEIMLSEIDSVEGLSKR